MTILLVEPFFAGSHRQWAEGYAQFSRHDLHLLTLPGRHWKWRMAAGAVSLAQQWLEAPARKVDLILATDMLDLPAFLSLSRPKSDGIPSAIYFHENQITYPWSPADADPRLGRDHHYGLINLKSALAADRVFFNSDFHRSAFLDALPGFLRSFPDFRFPAALDDLPGKCATLPLGLDLQLLKRPAAGPVLHKKGPVLLWNHRWEYDKNPDDFFRLCYRLKEAGLSFQLVVLGVAYRQVPPVFEEAREKLSAELLHMGRVPQRETYRYWLQQADILPVTSHQDFFGASVVEAISANTYPLLPHRLAYPEHIPEALRERHLYRDNEALFRQTAEAVRTWPRWRKTASFDGFVRHYDWRTLVGTYDQLFSDLSQ